MGQKLKMPVQNVRRGSDVTRPAEASHKLGYQLVRWQLIEPAKLLPRGLRVLILSRVAAYNARHLVGVSQAKVLQHPLINVKGVFQRRTDLLLTAVQHRDG